MIRSFITFTLSIIVALVVGGLLMAPYLSWKHVFVNSIFGYIFLIHRRQFRRQF
jgi:hypothetical protein